MSWKNVTYDNLDLLDLSQESTKTGILFIINLILMVCLMFYIVGILVITAIVQYAGDEVD